jgi:diguanylate cyclase (GGDEF)-like protein
VIEDERGPTRVAELRARRLRAAMRSDALGVAIAPASAVVYRLMLGDRLDGLRWGWFFAANLLLAAAVYVSYATYRRAARTRLVASWWPRDVTVALSGFVAGSMAILALPPAQADQMVTLLFILSSATSVMAWNDSWKHFWLYLCPSFSVTLFALVSHPDRDTRAMSGAVIAYLVICVATQRAIQRRAREIERLNADLALLLDHTTAQARTDALTGLANRRALLEAIDEALVARSEIGQALIFLDLDHFKVINDAHGHAAGDEVLCDVAARIVEVAGPGHLAARLGGDEFAVLHSGSDEEAQRLARRLARRLLEPFEYGDATWRVGASVGLTVVEPGDTSEALLRRADTAMFDAKRRGRGRVSVIDHDGVRVRDERARLAVELRHALAHDEIEPWFQPEVDLISGRVVGAEVLARWRHPSRGVLAAAAFIDVAADSDLLLLLSEHIATQAVIARARLATAGMYDDFVMRINVPPMQIVSAGQARAVLTAMNAVGCHPSWVSIEFTEQEQLVFSDETIAAVRLLRDAGVGVALDDFGTGLSSLATLQWFPLNEIKLDMRFVRELGDGAKNDAIVGGLHDLASRLGIGIVAEGVETVEIRQALIRLGITRAQGHLFAPAVPYAELVRLIEGEGFGAATVIRAA